MCMELLFCFLASASGWDTGHGYNAHRQLWPYIYTEYLKGIFLTFTDLLMLLRCFFIICEIQAGSASGPHVVHAWSALGQCWPYIFPEYLNRIFLCISQILELLRFVWIFPDLHGILSILSFFFSLTVLKVVLCAVHVNALFRLCTLWEYFIWIYMVLSILHVWFTFLSLRHCNVF